MRLYTLSLVLLVSLAVSKAIPSPKVIEKKSAVSEETKLEKKDDVKIEDSGDTKDRTKKSTTTFCVEIRPGASEPTRTVCGCNDKGELTNHISEKVEVMPHPPPRPAPQPAPAPEPAPQPAPQPAPEPAPRPIPRPMPRPLPPMPLPLPEPTPTVHFMHPAPEPCEIHIVQPVPQPPQIVEIVQPALKPTSLTRPSQAIEVLPPTVIPLPQPQEIKPAPAPRPMKIEVVPGPAPAPAPAPAAAHDCNDHAPAIHNPPAYTGQVMYMLPSHAMPVSEQQPQQSGAAVIQISGDLCPYQQHPGHPYITECSCRAKDVGAFHRSANAEPLKMVMAMGEETDTSTLRTHQKHPHTIVPIVLYSQGTTMPTQGSLPYVVQYNAPAQYPTASSPVSQARDGAGQYLMKPVWPDARTSIIVNPRPQLTPQMMYQKDYQSSYHSLVPGYPMGPSMIGPNPMGIVYRSDDTQRERASEVSDLMRSFSTSPKVPRNTDSEQNDEAEAMKHAAKSEEHAATSPKMNDEQSATATA